MNKENVIEYYYAVLPAEKAEHHETLYFWFTDNSLNGFPDDYGWSNRPKDKKFADKERMMKFLHNTLAFELARGHWSIEEVEGVEIHKVVEKTIVNVVESPADFDVGAKEIKKLCKQRYGSEV